MKSKSLLPIAIVMLALFLAAAACSTGFIVGRVTATPFPTYGLVSNGAGSGDTTAGTSTPGDTDQLFIPFWQAWKIVHEQYVDQPVDDVALMQGAIKGMMDSLGDQHSSYMNPTDYKTATDSLAGEYEGIGAWVNTDKDYLTITEPMPGSPAEQAGLKAGDQVIAIDGEDMTGIEPEMARLRVLGPKNSKVVLTIRREGSEQPFDVEITRASISVPSVTGKMLESGIAYVRIYNFGENTSQELEDTLKELLAQNPSGLVLDLRNNGGGYLQTGIEVASQFISKGTLMYEEYGDGRRNTFEAIPGGLATDIPMVVLVNEWSASASEIVAGALQDYERAPLVGVTTFGKGSVQNWIPLSNDQGAVRVTIARWLTPHERQIHKKGLTPDVEVKLTPEDVSAGKDPQLDAAVELLTKK